VTVLHLVLQVDTPASGWAAARDTPALVYAPVIAAILLMIVAYLLMGFARHAQQEPPHVETHWGGLGGGLGGWRVSASLAYLVAALAFGGMFTAFSMRWLFPPPPQAQETEKQTGGETSKADTTRAVPPAAGARADTTGRGDRSKDTTG
jgi:hypothetical protein